MLPKSMFFLTVLLGPAISFAGEHYVPKFPKVVRGVAIPAPGEMGAVPDRSARVLDAKACPKPAWPKASLRNEETGTTTISLTIAATGDVLGAMISRSSGFPGLDDAALSAMRNCIYRPAISGGVPVESILKTQYIWDLS